ncbi:hypothetical protein [Nostoc sp.]|uniref:hypothetical protein n=1 Tax=Nostoc sp. TaxID=1180 RepID=UPI002FF78AB6
MEKRTNGKQRTPQQKGSNQISHIKSESRGMGIIPAFGRRLRDDKIGTSRENSYEPDTVSAGEWTGGGIAGKLISQLIDENEKQLAYHQEQCYYHQKQAKKAQDTLERLRQIPETLADVVHTQ